MYRQEARLRAMIDPDRKNAWGGLDNEDREAIEWALKVIESRDSELQEVRHHTSRRYLESTRARAELVELTGKLKEAVARI